MWYSVFSVNKMTRVWSIRLNFAIIWHRVNNLLWTTELPLGAMEYTVRKLCFRRVFCWDQMFYFLFCWRDIRKSVDFFRDFIWFYMNERVVIFFVWHRFWTDLVDQLHVKSTLFFFYEFWGRKIQKTSHGGRIWFRFMWNNWPYDPEKLNGIGRIGPAPRGFFFILCKNKTNWARYGRSKFQSDTHPHTLSHTAAVHTWTQTNTRENTPTHKH